MASVGCDLMLYFSSVTYVTRFKKMNLAKYIIVIIGLSVSLFGSLQAEETIRIGVLKFGTVSWELDVIKRNQWDKVAGINLEIIPYGGKQATLVALQGGAVDVVVNDWLWVSKQRDAGKAYTFIPYSTALGSLMVAADSDIHAPSDLINKRLGIAGGALDKSWLLLQSLSRQGYALDLAAEAEIKFGAPPLINAQLENQRLDAVLNYWHYSARLEAKGYRQLVSINNVLNQLLGFKVDLPMIGYVFDQNWANERKNSLMAFQSLLEKSRLRLLNSDMEWESLRKLMRVNDEKTFAMLRDGYRSGIPKSWSKQERAAATIMTSILAAAGGEKLLGPTATLNRGTFWPEVEF